MLENGNGSIEIEFGKDGKKTVFRKCSMRLEMSGLSSLLGELMQARTSYEYLHTKYEKDEQDDALDPVKRNEAFSAKMDLEGRFRERAIPLANKVLGELSNRYVSGAAVGDYDLVEVMEVGARFVADHALSEEQRKNLQSGRDSSSPTRPQKEPESAANTSSTAKQESESAKGQSGTPPTPAPRVPEEAPSSSPQP